MYQASIENKNGDVLLLTGQEAVYQVIKITGLNPPKAQINTTTIVGLDGAVFNSSKLETRNLVLTIKINGDIEANRLNLYNYFKTKDWCKFYYSNDSLDVAIEGYVESVECNLFTNDETAQISIICPYPYFKGLSEITTDSGQVLALFTFPFSINISEPVVISNYEETGGVVVFNSSESECGVTIEIDVSDSINSIEIKNITTGDDFELDYVFSPQDKIIIDTNKGQKSITLIRNGVFSNLFAALKQGSVFFQLAKGTNVFEYLVDGAESNGKISLLFRYFNVYRGV